MYIYFLIISAFGMFSAFRGFITEGTVVLIYCGYAIQFVGYAFLAYLSYKGQRLQSVRDQIQAHDEKIYRPDSYAFRFLRLYFVFLLVTNIYSKIVEFIYLQDSRGSAVGEMIGYIISYGMIIIISSNEVSSTEPYDPLSKKFKLESDSSVLGNAIPLYNTIWNGDGAEENIVKMVENPAGDSTAFCVRAGDDSMKPSGILRGSLVYFSETAQLNKGDIVASLIGNQIVIRRAAYAEDGAFALEASNDAFPAMVFETQHQAHILGVATAIFIDMGK
jgi:hypothetical protein